MGSFWWVLLNILVYKGWFLGHYPLPNLLQVREVAARQEDRWEDSPCEAAWHALLLLPFCSQAQRGGGGGDVTHHVDGRSDATEFDITVSIYDLHWKNILAMGLLQQQTLQSDKPQPRCLLHSNLIKATQLIQGLIIWNPEPEGNIGEELNIYTLLLAVQWNWLAIKGDRMMD